MLIRNKLALGSIGLITLTGLSGIAGLLLLNDIQMDLEQSNKDLIPHSAAAMETTEALLHIHSQAQEMVRFSFDTQNTSADQFEIEATFDKLQKSIKEAKDNIETVGIPLALKAHNREELQGEKEELNTLIGFNNSCLVLKSRAMTMKSLARTNAEAASGYLEHDIEPMIRELLPKFEAYQEDIWGEMKEENLQIGKSVKQMELMIVVSTIGGLVLAAAAARFLSRAISRPIFELQEAVRKIGLGDRNVCVDISRRDEVGNLARAFNQMTSDLRETTVSKDYMDAIIRSMGDMLIVVDPEGNIRSVNRSLTESLGYSESDLAGATFVSLFVSQFDLSLEAVKDGSVHYFEAAFRKKDGSAAPVSLSGSTLRDRRNQLNGWVWVAKDITARKMAEIDLERANKELLTASRQAGMAEIATNVIHNVGNVLNSVNIAGSFIAERTKNSRVVKLSKVGELLKARQNDLGDFLVNDPRGKQLPGYISSLASHLEQERELILREISTLIGHIVHIKEIVSMQQNYARSVGVTELLKITDLVEDAIRMNNGAMNRHEIKIVREFAETPTSVIDKHKVLQILVNLIRNAKYACDDGGRENKQIILRVENDKSSLRISVVDNGIGIPRENLTRIFNHGFTTRKTGHGFGLHSGAIAAKQMGGNLNVFSEGEGRGAAFTLELPLILPTPQQNPALVSG